MQKILEVCVIIGVVLSLFALIGYSFNSSNTSKPVVSKYSLSGLSITGGSVTRSEDSVIKSENVSVTNLKIGG